MSMPSREDIQVMIRIAMDHAKLVGDLKAALLSGNTAEVERLARAVCGIEDPDELEPDRRHSTLQ